MRIYFHIPAYIKMIKNEVICGGSINDFNGVWIIIYNLHNFDKTGIYKYEREREIAGGSGQKV